jgi:hypothetical protein
MAPYNPDMYGEYKQRIEVLLVLASPSLTEKGVVHYLMSVDSGGKLQLPSVLMAAHESSLVSAAKLLKDTTGLSAKLTGSGFIKLSQAGLFDDINRKRLITWNNTWHGSGGEADKYKHVNSMERVIGIPYGAIVPHELVKPDVGYKWVELSTMLQSEVLYDHLEIIKSTSLRL